jgi:hypothetical protein
VTTPANGLACSPALNPAHAVGTEEPTASGHAAPAAVALLAQLDTDHPTLAARPARERLLTAVWLAGYRSPRTRRAYALDLTAWLGLHDLQVDVLAARRVHVDLWVRHLLDTGAASSSTARRLSALTSFYRHLIAHDVLAVNPAAAVRRPRVDPDHTSTVGLDRAQARAFLAAADTDPGPARLRTAATARLLLHLGLRVDELAAADTTDLGHDRGHRILTVTPSTATPPTPSPPTSPAPEPTTDTAQIRVRSFLAGLIPTQAFPRVPQIGTSATRHNTGRTPASVSSRRGRSARRVSAPSTRGTPAAVPTPRVPQLVGT